MKIKKALKKLLEFGLGVSAGYLTYLLVKAELFKKSLDINKDSLDAISIFKNLNIKYTSQKARDFKLGCFFGTIRCNLGALQFDTITDITVCAEQGIITLFVPKDLNIIVVSKRIRNNNILNYHQNPESDSPVAIINADINFGLLVIKDAE